MQAFLSRNSLTSLAERKEPKPADGSMHCVPKPPSQHYWRKEGKQPNTLKQKGKQGKGSNHPHQANQASTTPTTTQARKKPSKQKERKGKRGGGKA